MSNDLRVLRRRQEDAQVEAERRVYGAENGAPVLVGRTTSDGAYPTSARAVYKIALDVVNCQLKEGAPVSFATTGAFEYAANFGSAVPPFGTEVRLDLMPGGRFAFEYDG